MHIVVLSLNRGRGSGVVARHQVAALIARGHRVTHMHPGMRAGVAGAISRNVPLHSSVTPVHEFLPAEPGEQVRVSAMSTATARRYLADFAAALDGLGDVDLIVAHHATITAIAAAEFAAKRAIPYLVFVHGTAIEPRVYGGYTDEVWSQIEAAVAGASGIQVTTEYVRDSLVRPLVNVPIERFLVLPCGVDLEEFRRSPGATVRATYDLPERYVICPGALTYSKGPQNVVSASRFYADLAPTVFIGDGNLAAELKSTLGDRGRLLGFVSHADKASLINSATILTAAPVKREHFGIIYVEALAAGAVPVAYEGGGVGSIVSPECGILTARTPRALGNAIRRLLLDDEDLARMSVAGRRRAENVFDEAEIQTEFVKWVETTATTPLLAAER